MIPRAAAVILVAVATVAAARAEETPGLAVLSDSYQEEAETSVDFVFDEPEEPALEDPREVPLRISEELELSSPPREESGPAKQEAAPPLELGPRHVWFAGTSGPLRYGRGVLLRPAEEELAPRLELRLQVAHRLSSGDPSPVGFRIATNYLTWLRRYEIEVERAVGKRWMDLFTREGPLEDLLPVVPLRRDEVARMFCAGPRMRVRVSVWDAADRVDRTGWLEFRVRPPAQTYEGLALVSSPSTKATREVAGIPLVGARPAELWSVARRPRGAWTRSHIAGTLLARLLLPLESVPPLHWSRGHLGDPARLDPVWYWEGDLAEALMSRPPGEEALGTRIYRWAAEKRRALLGDRGQPEERSTTRPRIERPREPRDSDLSHPEGALPPWVAWQL
jgi:hypothetical protein